MYGSNSLGQLPKGIIACSKLSYVIQVAPLRSKHCVVSSVDQTTPEVLAPAETLIVSNTPDRKQED